MPHALNLPFGTVQAHGRMRPAQELAALFASRVEPQQKLIFSCGSGVTACILALAAELAGYRALSVYDGSWSEWGQPSSRPVVTAPL
jgi:thiosulfate/3-mercaptopyruvate sulfurtransferase